MTKLSDDTAPDPIMSSAGWREHMEQTPDYWEDYGARAGAEVKRRLQLTPEQINVTLQSTMARIKLTDEARRDAFIRGFHQGYGSTPRP